MVTVRPSPGTLAVAVANGGALKRGATVEAKVTLTRANGFTGPVTLSLPLPPNVAGLAAPAVVIPADKTEGTLVIQAAGDATMGQLANLVVRASMEFDGQSAIDQPIAINVQQ
jgi:adenosylcobinamide amidohydrolase